MPEAATTTQPTLTSAWRKTFWVEIPIVGATVAYWLLSPADFLTQSMMFETVDSPAIFLLYLYACSVFSLVFWFYLRLLRMPNPDRATFRAFQEGLLIGDVGIVATTMWFMASSGHNMPLLWVQIGMATLWGSIRATYLLRN